MSQLFEDVLSIVKDVCASAGSTITKMADMRKRPNAFPPSPFPNFDEIKILSEEAKLERQLSPGDKLVSLMPSHITEKNKSDDLRIWLIEQIIAAAVYPDLFKRPHTPERIATAICDLIDGYISALIVTSIWGVYTKSPFKLDQTLVCPMPRFYGLWLQEHTQWGTVINAGFAHALLLTERRFPYNSITEESFKEEPTSQELQALRLATNSEVISLGSIMRGVVFLMSPSSPFGFGTRFWPVQHKKMPLSSIILTEEHISEAPPQTV